MDYQPRRPQPERPIITLSTSEADYQSVRDTLKPTRKQPTTNITTTERETAQLDYFQPEQPSKPEAPSPLPKPKDSPTLSRKTIGADYQTIEQMAESTRTVLESPKLSRKPFISDETPMKPETAEVDYYAPEQPKPVMDQRSARADYEIVETVTENIQTVAESPKPTRKPMVSDTTPVLRETAALDYYQLEQPKTVPKPKDLPNLSRHTASAEYETVEQVTESIQAIVESPKLTRKQTVSDTTGTRSETAELDYYQPKPTPAPKPELPSLTSRTTG